MASKRSSSTAQHMLRTIATWVMATAKLGAIACALTLLVSGSSLLEGSHAGRNDLLGKSFSMVSFSGIAAKDAGTTLPYLVRMHWLLNSFGWEWLETTTETDGAGYVFIQPARPLLMPAVLHDVADSLRRAGHTTTNCQSAAETCIGLSGAFFEAFDSTSSLALSNGPAFVFYVLALVFDVVFPALFSCLGFFRIGGAENRWIWLKDGLLALPAAFHLISASVATSNARSLVAYLDRFPNVSAGAAIGHRFLIVTWCGVIAELMASTASIARTALMRLPSFDDNLAFETARDIPVKSRKRADQA